MRRRSKDANRFAPFRTARDACQSAINRTEWDATMPKSIYVFDAYGTLFDVNSAARECECGT